MSARKSAVAQAPTERYSAKLLFQLRVGNETGSAPMRISEQRIVTFEATSPGDAYGRAVAYGKAAQVAFPNADGVLVHLEFVGVMDLMHLGAESDANEVWYEMKRMRAPMERRATLIPPKAELAAFRLISRMRRGKGKGG